MNFIEVERKFTCSPETKIRLLSLRTSGISTKVFHDCYYSKSLALADKWLRNRSGVWELKVPTEYNKKSRMENTIYRELVGNDVWDLLGLSSFQRKNLDLFAKITTKRTQISINRNGQDINIVLDECYSGNGFQCTLCEAEVIVNRVTEIDAAITALDEISTSLNLSLVQDNDGKLFQYLKYCDRQFYNSLFRQRVSKHTQSR